MYKIFMLIAVPTLAIAWIAYAIWLHKVREEEKKRPRRVSQRLAKTHNELADWAKKMAEFQPPKRKKPSPQDQNNQPDSQ